MMLVWWLLDCPVCVCHCHRWYSFFSGSNKTMDTHCTCDAHSSFGLLATGFSRCGWAFCSISQMSFNGQFPTIGDSTFYPALQIVWFLFGKVSFGVDRSSDTQCIWVLYRSCGCLSDLSRAILLTVHRSSGYQ